MKGKIKVTKIFGQNVFDDATMKEQLPKKILLELKRIHYDWKRPG